MAVRFKGPVVRLMKSPGLQVMYAKVTVGGTRSRIVGMVTVEFDVMFPELLSTQSKVTVIGETADAPTIKEPSKVRPLLAIEIT